MSAASDIDLGIHPLVGIRIVTLAVNVPGPMAAQRLRALGADVIKMEPPGGDPLQSFSPSWYTGLAQGMSVERCDLRTETGHVRLRQLLAGSDLLLTAQRPAALHGLALGWDELRSRFPRLCQVAIVGYAAPEQNRPGHDLTYMAANGLLTPPALPATLFVDVMASEQAVVAALAALRERDRTGRGHYAEIALAAAAKRLAAPRASGLTAAGAILGGGFPGYQLYRSKDGWIAVAALEDRFYRRLCEQLGMDAPSYKTFAAYFAAESNDYWSHFAQAHDLPLAVVEPLASGR